MRRRDRIGGFPFRHLDDGAVFRAHHHRRAVRDEAYAELLLAGTHPATGWSLAGTVSDRFATETLAMHRRVTGLADVTGRLQPPWPRPLGTPPWALARQLSGAGRRYVVRPAVLGRPRVLDRVRAALVAGTPVAVYVGDRWLPRHVVLALEVRGDGFLCYDPAMGGQRLVTGEDFTSARLPGRWSRPWLVVRPG
jgi:hypothetical protein